MCGHVFGKQPVQDELEEQVKEVKQQQQPLTAMNDDYHDGGSDDGNGDVHDGDGYGCAVIMMMLTMMVVTLTMMGGGQASRAGLHPR